MKKLILVLMLCISVITCYAGSGYYITVKNETSDPMYLSFGGADEWYANDFAEDNIVQPYSSIRLYTEDKAGKDTSFKTYPGICGLNITGRGFSGGKIQIWRLDHAHSVDKNITTLYSTGIGSNNHNITTSLESKAEGFYTTYYGTVIIKRTYGDY